MTPLLNLPTAENAVIRLHDDDNVAVARAPLPTGQMLRVDGREIVLRSPVPYGHKVALTDIAAGAPVVRYSTVIGRVREAVGAGEHVHSHNLVIESGAQTFDFPDGELEAAAPEEGPAFLGYRRPDGRAGTRNYIAILPASLCAVHACKLVARSFPRESLPAGVDGVAVFPHGHGCGIQIGSDSRQLERVISGILDHPNLAFSVLVGLGCEVNQITNYLGRDALRDERVVGLTLQESGGTTATVQAAARAVSRMIEAAAAMKREEIPASELMLGLQCGGSDALSGVTANPALGACCDRLVRFGGTAVLAETPETFGAENLLVRRACSRAVAERYLALVDQYKEYLRPYGSTFDDNPSPGNKEGGLTNILEKSLGAVAKAGATPMMEAYDYAERVSARGFVFMNSPGNDTISMTGIASGGANIMAFTTGRGSANGYPIVPVIKISSNSTTYHRMRENIDVNAGRIADGEATVDEIGQEIFEYVLRVASGERTGAERLGHDEFEPWRIGPTL